MGRFSWCATSSESEPDVGDWGDEGPYLHETKGFLETCYYCGLRMRLETEKNPQFAGRLTYVCPKHKDGGHHQSKWWDMAVNEEIEQMKLRVDEQSDELRKMTINKEVDVLDANEVLARMKAMEASFLTLKDDVEQCSQELLKIKEGSQFCRFWRYFNQNLMLGRTVRVLVFGMLCVSMLANIVFVLRQT